MNVIGLARDLAQAGGKYRGIAADVGERFGRAPKVARAILRLEGALHRHHHMPAPGGAGVTLIGLRAARDSEVLAAREAHDAAVWAGGGRHPGAGGNLVRIGARDDLIPIVDEGEHAPVRFVTQLVEDARALVLELEAQGTARRRCRPCR